MKAKRIGHVICLLLLVLSCTKEEKANVESVNVKGRINNVSKNFHPLDKEATKFSNFSLDTGKVEVTFLGEERSAFQKDELIVVDLDSIGYLRKVTSVEKKSDTEISLTTEPAFMGDIFVDSHFKLSSENLNVEQLDVSTSNRSTSEVNQKISEAFTDSQGYIHPIQIAFTKKDGSLEVVNYLERAKNNILARENKVNEITLEKTFNEVKKIDNGTFSFSGRVFGDLVMLSEFQFKNRIVDGEQIEKGNLEVFEFKLAGNLGTEASFNLKSEGKSKKEEKAQVSNFDSVTLKFLVSTIPLYITITPELWAEYNVDANAKLEANWGFETNNTVEAGLRYTLAEGDIEPIKNYTRVSTPTALTSKNLVNLKSKVYIYPYFKTLIYNFAGPFIEISPYAQANFSTASLSSKASETAWESSMDLGLDLNTGVNIKFIKEEVSVYGPRKLNLFHTNAYKSPDSIHVLRGPIGTIKAGESIGLQLQVKDNLGSPAPFAVIVVDDKNEFIQKRIVTDILGKKTISWTPKKTSSIDIGIVGVNGQARKNINLSSKVLNQPPSTPKLSSPDNAATITASLSLKLSWETSTDPERDAITYAIHLGATQNATSLISTTTATTFTTSLLAEKTTYYWKIGASDIAGNTTYSEIRSFTTAEANNPPSVPILLSPKQGEAVDISSVKLHWERSTDPEKNPVLYNIYWGKNNPPTANVVKGRVFNTYPINSSEYNTTYYWQIAAIDSKGATASSTVSSFTASINIYTGNKILTTQQEVDSFSANKYTGITGSLTVSGTSITNIYGLSSLTSVGGKVSISNNSGLTNLTGLSNLTSVGGSLVINNNALTNLNGLSSLTSIGEILYIGYNNALTDLTGLSNLTSIGSQFWILYNNALTNLNGLSGLTSIVGAFFIRNNDILNDLSGLSNLTSVGDDFWITKNKALTNLNGLSSLTSVVGKFFIDGNNVLNDLSGLSNLASVVGFDIRYNTVLTNLNGLSGLTSVAKDFFIQNNDAISTTNGLSNLATIGGVFYIYKNKNLINLNSLSSLTSIGGGLTIRENIKLTNIDGLSSLASVGGIFNIQKNTTLVSLNGLSSLTSIAGRLLIYDNTALTNFCVLQTLITNKTFTTSITYMVSNNAYNPTQTEIQSSTTCKQ